MNYPEFWDLFQSLVSVQSGKNKKRKGWSDISMISHFTWSDFSLIFHFLKSDKWSDF